MRRRCQVGLRADLGFSPAPCDSPPAEPFGFGVSQVKLSDALPRVGEGDPYCGAFSLGDFVA
jgi:hypothetical protein